MEEVEGKPISEDGKEEEQQMEEAKWENEDGSRGKDLMGADEDAGFKMVLGIVNSDNLLDVCLKIIG